MGLRLLTSLTDGPGSFASHQGLPFLPLPRNNSLQQAAEAQWKEESQGYQRYTRYQVHYYQKSVLVVGREPLEGIRKLIDLYQPMRSCVRTSQRPSTTRFTSALAAPWPRIPSPQLDFPRGSQGAIVAPHAWKQSKQAVGLCRVLHG